MSLIDIHIHNDAKLDELIKLTKENIFLTKRLGEKMSGIDEKFAELQQASEKLDEAFTELTSKVSEQNNKINEQSVVIGELNAAIDQLNQQLLSGNLTPSQEAIANDIISKAQALADIIITPVDVPVV